MIGGIGYNFNVEKPYSYNGYQGQNAETKNVELDAFCKPVKEEDDKAAKNPGQSDEKKAGRKSSPADCETCKNRKYQDGSDEMVSFKAASHISPQAAASRVKAHEQEHVSNAFKKAEQNNGKVISANVTIKTAICPECGRSYVAGGETATQIKYYNEENPYQKDLKNQDADKYAGMNVNFAC